MLRLSKKSDYAIVALSHLQAADSPASARQIANTYGLSPQMLANVLKMLASAGLLRSKRGVTGGYSLGREPSNIYVGEVIDIIEGPISFFDCTDKSKDCKAKANCPAKLPMLMIHQKIKNFIDNLSLADIKDKNFINDLTLFEAS